MTRPEKSECERAVFGRFVSIANLPIDPASIESREPPEPDILCQYQQSGSIAFELVELIDQDFAHRLSNQMGSQQLLERCYKQLPISAKTNLDARFNNGDICFELKVPRMRRSDCDNCLRELSAVDTGFSGTIYSFAFPGVGRVVRSINVCRGNFNGPAFSVKNIGGVRNPARDSIAKKLQSTYTTSYPIELLAYLDVRAMLPTEFWKPVTEEYVNSLPSLGPFRKIWIVDLAAKRVECIHQ